MNSKPLLPWLVTAAILSQFAHAGTVYSNLIDSPVSTVFSHNTGIGPSLLGMNAHTPGQAYGPGNPNYPILAFYANARTIMPSVDNRISASRQPYIVWSWAADQSPTINTGDTNGCGHQKISMTLDHTSSSFSLYSQLNGNTARQDNPGNPAALPYGSTELQNNAGKNINAWISGVYSAYYKVMTETVQCQGACGSGGCTTYVWIDTKTETKQYSAGTTTNTLSYTISPSGMTDFLALPFSNRQSYENPQVAWLAFTNADAAKYYALMDGKLFSAAYMAKFSVYNDDKDVWTTSKTNAKQSGLDPADSNGQAMPKISLAGTLDTQTNVSAQTALDAIGLEGTFTHIYTFNHHLPDLQILGQHPFTFKIFDEFGDSQDKTYTITTVAPTTLKLTTNATTVDQNGLLKATATLLDQEKQPLSNRQIQFKTLNYTTYASTNALGTATTEMTMAQPGLQTVTSSFTGDAQYAEKSQSQTVKVLKQTDDGRVHLALQSNSLQILFMILAFALALGFRS